MLRRVLGRFGDSGDGVRRLRGDVVVVAVSYRDKENLPIISNHNLLVCNLNIIKLYPGKTILLCLKR